MPYKVFLVEDEITTREGIRDNVAWEAGGFTLCGEASDGEIALPQIEAAQPDVLITDIKMPFMDGLQLCKIIREYMPWMKIIIISGHSDFQYAQTAIQLGVTEYLLKPVSVQDLQAVLAKVAVMLDQEKSERAYLKRLSSQVEENLSLLREKFLLRLVTGGESSASAVEQSKQLGLNILAPFYQVILFEARPGDADQAFSFSGCQQIEQAITATVGMNTDVLLTKKDMEEFVLLLKADRQEQIEQEGRFLSELIREEVENRTDCKVLVGIGTVQQRLGDLHRSFAEALMQLKSVRAEVQTDALTKLDHAALRLFLETGQPEQYDDYFDAEIRPLMEVSQRSSLLKRYIIIDLLLTISQYTSDLGGSLPRVYPASAHEEEYLSSLLALEETREEIRKLFGAVFAFRDRQAVSDRMEIIQQAKGYIGEHFSDPNLSLNEVAARVNFSPNHFSAVFSEETGITFREFLAQTRIENAKRLLRTTKLKVAEVAFQCGYNDSHYFSLTFRKSCGMTPQQFRAAGPASRING